MISSQSSNYSAISTAVTTKSTKVGQLYIPISEYEHYNGSEWVPVDNFSVEGTIKALHILVDKKTHVC